MNHHTAFLIVFAHRVVAVFNMQRVNVVQTNEFALFAPTKTPTIQISYSKDSALYPTPGKYL